MDIFHYNYSAAVNACIILQKGSKIAFKSEKKSDYFICPQGRGICSMNSVIDNLYNKQCDD